jgi:DNA-directed RNA polymerase specialized sigma24 family protein
MNQSSSGGWDKSWDKVIDLVISRVGLGRVCGSRDDAKQFLCAIIIDFGLDRFRNASAALRYTVLHRRAVDEVRKFLVRDDTGTWPGPQCAWSDEAGDFGQEPTPTPEQIVSNREIIDKFDEISSRMLPERDRKMLNAYYKEQKTQEEIALDHQVSRPRAQQVIDGAMAYVVRHMNDPKKR